MRPLLEKSMFSFNDQIKNILNVNSMTIPNYFFVSLKS